MAPPPDGILSLIRGEFYGRNHYARFCSREDRSRHSPLSSGFTRAPALYLGKRDVLNTCYVFREIYQARFFPWKIQENSHTKDRENLQYIFSVYYKNYRTPYEYRYKKQKLEKSNMERFGNIQQWMTEREQVLLL